MRTRAHTREIAGRTYIHWYRHEEFGDFVGKSRLACTGTLNDWEDVLVRCAIGLLLHAQDGTGQLLIVIADVWCLPRHPRRCAAMELGVGLQMDQTRTFLWAVEVVSSIVGKKVNVTYSVPNRNIHGHDCRLSHCQCP